eukprot:2636063-Pleurochrysis_carterae.AAC.1
MKRMMKFSKEFGALSARSVHPFQSVSTRYKSSKRARYACAVEMTSKCNNVQGSIEAVLSQP